MDGEAGHWGPALGGPPHTGWGTHPHHHSYGRASDDVYLKVGPVQGGVGRLCDTDSACTDGVTGAGGIGSIRCATGVDEEVVVGDVDGGGGVVCGGVVCGGVTFLCHPR